MMSSNDAPLARRATKHYRQAIDAPPGTVFPLLCPVREVEWLDGWTYRMCYSASGLAEPGAVFTTSSPGEADTVWIVSRHDPAARIVEFCRVTPGSRTCRLRIAVSNDGETRSAVDVSYEYTSLSAGGDAFIDEWTDDTFTRAMRFWEASMNHFLRTGIRLPKDHA